MPPDAVGVVAGAVGCAVGFCAGAAVAVEAVAGAVGCAVATGCRLGLLGEALCTVPVVVFCTVPLVEVEVDAGAVGWAAGLCATGAVVCGDFRAIT